MCFKISTRGSGFEHIEILNTCLDSFNPKLNNKLNDLSNNYNVEIEWVRPNITTNDYNDNNTND